MEKFGLLSAHKDRSIFDSGRKRKRGSHFLSPFLFPKKNIFCRKKNFFWLSRRNPKCQTNFSFSFFSLSLLFIFYYKRATSWKSQVGYSDPFIVPTFFSPDRLCSIRFDPLRWKKQKICSFHFCHQRSLQRRRRGRVFLFGTRRENSAKLRNLKSKSLNDVDFDFDFD